jgi:hypothetical protein
VVNFQWAFRHSSERPFSFLESVMDQHDIEKRDASCAHPVNEVGRIAIALPEDVTFYSDRRFIAVAFDAGAHGVMHEILGGSRSYLPFRAAYEIFSDLCNDRAIHTVDGELLVDGKTIRFLKSGMASFFSSSINMPAICLPGVWRKWRVCHLPEARLGSTLP